MKSANAGRSMEGMGSASPGARVFAALEGMNMTLFFSLAILYQVLLTLQGIDLMDEGFHVVLYQQFFHAPESIQYMFGYWLTGLVGAVLMKLTSPLGLWGIRLCGVAITTLTLGITYQFLRRFIPKGELLVSLILILIFLNSDPKNFYYNNFSAFLYVAAVILMFNGITRDRNLLLFWSGLLVGLNIFTRLPNLLGLGLSAGVLYHAIVTRTSWATVFQRMIWFFAGAIWGIAIVIGLMYFIGHLGYFGNAVRIIFQTGAGKSGTAHAEGGYGIIDLIKLVVKQYFNAIYLVVVSFATLAIGFGVFHHFRDRKSFVERIIKITFAGLAIVLLLHFIKTGIYEYKLLNIIVGVLIFGSVIFLLGNKSPEFRTIVFLGLFVLLVHPLGSFVGIVMVIPYSLWLILPIVLHGMAQVEGVDHQSLFPMGGKTFPVRFSISRKEASFVKTAAMLTFILTCAFQIMTRPYLEDRHSRTKMRYAVKEDAKMKFVLTSKDRAEVLDELLSASARYIGKDGKVLAFDMIPMYHYMSETLPYVQNPCPWYYNGGLFAEQLEIAERSGPLPSLVVQKTGTIGEASNRWPEEVPAEDYRQKDRNRYRNEVLQGFIQKHGYKVVWENRIFCIMKPGSGG